MIERWFRNECGFMTNGNETNAQHAEDHPEEVVLEAVDDAIHAVQNDPIPQEKTTSAQPTDSFPELDDVEDTTTKVEGLLQIGEERSRSGDTKGALTAFNKAIALDPASDMAWFLSLIHI